jgi:UV DNA damage endonuclease
MAVSAQTGVPVLFDIFHHRCLNTGLTSAEAMALAASTWKKSDGAPIVDYSSQKKGGRPGSHTESIVPADFARALKIFSPYNCDIMLEIKDKEKSALKALGLLFR